MIIRLSAASPSPTHSWLVAGIMALLLTLGGCAHSPTSNTQVDNWTQHQTQLQQLTDWQLTGKLGVRVPNDSGSATLRWLNSGKNYSIDLSGPFGQGRMLINGKPGRVSLQQAGEAPLTADSAAALIHQATGWTLPVEQLTYWVRGVPAPQRPVTWLQKNDAGLLSTLQQMGWEIHYSDYTDVPANGKRTLTLPGKIIATYKEIRLTLIIRQWQLNP